MTEPLDPGRGSASSDRLREELVTVLAEATATRPAAQADPPYVGFDESVNSPILSAAVLRLLERGYLSGACPLWNKKRLRADRSTVYVLGGVTKGVPLSAFHGTHDAPHATWPDELVLSGLIAYFLSYDRLILLSENTRLDCDGLRWLLLHVVKPVLAAQHGGRFTLTALFKKPRTNWPQYAARVSEFIEARHIEPGYSEVRL